MLFFPRLGALVEYDEQIFLEDFKFRAQLLGGDFHKLVNKLAAKRKHGN